MRPPHPAQCATPINSEVPRRLGWMPFERALRTSWRALNSSSVISGGPISTGEPSASRTDSPLCARWPISAQAARCPAESLEFASVAPPACRTPLELGVSVSRHQNARAFEFVGDGDQGQSGMHVVDNCADDGDGLVVGRKTPADSGGVRCLLVPERHKATAVSARRAQHRVSAGEAGRKRPRLLFGSVGQVHAAANGVAVCLRCHYQRLTLFRHPEDECGRMLLTPFDQLGHVGDGAYGAVHM